MQLKKLLPPILVLLCATSVSAQGVRYQLSTPAPNAQVLVCPSPDAGYPCPVQQAIYSDVGLTQVINQPVSLGSSGFFSFYVTAGTYTIQLTGPGYNSSNRQIVNIGGGSSASPLASNGGIWQKMGTVIYSDPTSAVDQGASQEPSVICEGSPQVITTGVPMVCGPPGTATTANAVLKMWWTCGWVAVAVCYAESTDALNWVRRSTSVLTAHAHGRVFKNGSTYHYYGANAAAGTQIDHYTSTDGIVWTQSALAVVGLGAGGLWDSTSLGNVRVWIEGSTWYMLYEAFKTAGQWSTGIATSTDGVGNVWTKNVAVNPLCVGCGGAFKYKDATGNYWVWTHSAPAGSSLPSDIYRWNLTGLTTTPALVANPAASVLYRTTLDEGGQSLASGQLADVMYIDWNNHTLAFYEGTYDGGTVTANIHIKVAVADIPLASVVFTNEGVAPSARAFDSSKGISIGNPAIGPIPGALFITNTAKAGYPGFEAQYITSTVSPFTDVGFLGYNMLLAANGGISRTSTSFTAVRKQCTIAALNVNGGCFWGLTNVAGTEGFPIQGYFDTPGNVYDILPELTAGGTAPVLSGTGACATITTQLGGWTGTFKCTGTTGASTVTMTFGAGAATNGWTCSAQDETTRANLLQQTSHTATTCVLTATSVTANDIFVFTSIGF